MAAMRSKLRSVVMEAAMTLKNKTKTSLRPKALAFRLAQLARIRTTA